MNMTLLLVSGLCFVLLNAPGVESQELAAYAKYDFVPGEKIIFADDLAGEKMGEFPSRWNLLRGGAENARHGDQNIVSFTQGNNRIEPLMRQKNYLPGIFTIEFDLYFHKKGNEAYSVDFGKAGAVEFRPSKVSMKAASGTPKGGADEAGWHHVAISFNTRAMKLYMDQDRMVIIPNLVEKPTAFSLTALSHGATKGYAAMVKNVRVAEGGMDLYQRVVTDGKIVTRGILLDVGNATIKPTSMGVLNDIAALMKDHAELKFSIEGHTDGDGSDQSNQTLSDARANAVLQQLVSMGIDAGRVTAKGWGEGKPVDTNETPEGKANNRRVEFVKI
ncbi:MAG: OmpA family protein [Nitrospira defluvii]|nr:OmpA family protein [Nitrospira defluvii]